MCILATQQFACTPDKVLLFSVTGQNTHLALTKVVAKKKKKINVMALIT